MTDLILNKSEQKLYKSLEKELGNNSIDRYAVSSSQVYDKDSFSKVINQIIKSSERGREIHLKRLKFGNGCFDIIQK